MKKTVLLLLAIIAHPASGNDKVKTPADFLNWHLMPLMIKTSPNSDLRIKLRRGGKVEGEMPDPKIAGTWHSTGRELFVDYSDGQEQKQKHLKYDLKLVKDTRVAPGYDLLINGKKLVFTAAEEIIFDENLPRIPQRLKKKCEDLIIERARATDLKDISINDKTAATLHVKRPSIFAVFQQKGLKADSNVSIVSDTNLDCLYHAHLSLDLKARTCSIESFKLDHCAK